MSGDPKEDERPVARTHAEAPCEGAANGFGQSAPIGCRELADRAGAETPSARSNWSCGSGAPAGLLVRFASLLVPPPGPVLDLACGDGRNGLFLAELWAQYATEHGSGSAKADQPEVVLCDRSAEALATARRAAEARRVAERGVRLEFRQADLEARNAPPLPEAAYGVILVFRYLHRPLLPAISKALRPGGLLVYETYLREHGERFGKPSNPDFLLQPGELARSFAGFDIIHSFEGFLDEPLRISAQLVCRKPV